MTIIKLTNVGMDSFTGYLGTVKFENGASVEQPSQAEINRLAALTRIELVEEDGTSKQAGLGVAMAENRDQKIPVLKDAQVGEKEPHQVEVNLPDIEIKSPNAKVDAEKDAMDELDKILEDTAPQDEAEAQPESDPEPAHSREYLEEIADKEGISGLRKIADPLGVKDNSIKGLIAEILTAQGNV